MEYLIGIDLGGTTINIGAVSTQGKVLEEHILNTAPQQGPEKAIAQIAEAIRTIETSLNKKKQNKMVGVGLPGIFNHKEGKIVQASNLPGWEDYPFTKAVSTALDMDVLVKNDADLAALGECWIGSGKAFEDVFVITLGSGIGGARIRDNNIVEKNNFSGEFGHMVINLDGDTCTCGRKGCVETYFSKHGIIQRTKNHLTNGKDTLLKNYTEDKFSPLLVATLAKHGDEVARAIIDEAVLGLATAMANITNTHGITNFILGGGISNAWDIFEAPLHKYLSDLVFDIPDTSINIVKASLGEKAGIIGAAKYALSVNGISNIS
ncbi:MAG: ROK family protein [Bacteroidota bacterium]